MPRVRFPKRDYIDENDKFKAQIQDLVDAIIAVQEYHEALNFLEVTGKKADQLKVIKQKKQEYLFCLEQVADLIADNGDKN